MHFNFDYDILLTCMKMLLYTFWWVALWSKTFENDRW